MKRKYAESKKCQTHLKNVSRTSVDQSFLSSSQSSLLPRCPFLPLHISPVATFRHRMNVFHMESVFIMFLMMCLCFYVYCFVSFSIFVIVYPFYSPILSFSSLFPSRLDAMLVFILVPSTVVRRNVVTPINYVSRRNSNRRYHQYIIFDSDEYNGRNLSLWEKRKKSIFFN